jgi:hypothetical protein
MSRRTSSATISYHQVVARRWPVRKLSGPAAPAAADDARCARTYRASRHGNQGLTLVHFSPQC